MGKRFPSTQMDPIRRELEALEEQLRPKQPLTERIMGSCPLLPPAAGFLVGLICQRRFDFSFSFWAAVFPALILPLIYVFRESSHQKKLAVLLGLSVAAGLFLGAVRLRLYQTPAPHDIRNMITEDQTLTTLQGRITTDPQVEDRSRWVFGGYQWTPRSTTFILEIEEALTRTGWQPVSGTVYATVSEPVKGLAAGDRIRFHCRLSRFQPPDNPGMFDTRQYLADRGITLSASIPAAESIESHEKNHNGFLLHARNRLRYWTREAMDACGGDQKQFSSLPETILLGKRASLDGQTWTAFQKTGLAHFISLSGLHVGILSGILWWILRTLGLEKRTRALLCILLIGLYALVVPPRPPTLRAVFITEFIFLSILISRRARMLNTLSLTVLILLLFRPTEVFQASWQLSYTTVFGIVLLYKPVYGFLSGPLYAFPQITDRLFRLPAADWLWAGLQSILQLLSVGLAAWLGGAGILLWHFGIVTPLSAVWTVLVFPLVFLILLIGFMKLLLLPLLPTLAAVCSVWLDRLSDLFSHIAGGLARLDLFSFQIGRTALWIILLYYAWLFCIRFAPRYGKPKKILVTVGALAIIFSLMIPKLQRCLSKDLTLTCLSVGHGLAVVGRLPGGQTFLFDTGSITLKNPGGRVVVPFLNFRGIESLDMVMLSHGDLDHYNGLPEVLSAVRTKAVYANPGFLQRAQLSSGAGRMKTIFQSTGSSFSPDVFTPSCSAVQISRLWPDEKAASDPSLTDNDKSEVLLIEYAGKTILLCGDIEEYAQRQILSSYPDLKADILLLPHHGSRNNILPEFIWQLHSEIRVISCARNRVKSTIDLDEKAQNWYTPLHGAVTVTIKADGTVHAAGFLNE